jgi:CRP-like cAMP-binding protein
LRPGVAALKTLSLLRGFDDDALKTLDETADQTGFGPGELLFREGAALDELHILTKGQVAAIRGNGQDDPLLADVWTAVWPL